MGFQTFSDTQLNARLPLLSKNIAESPLPLKLAENFLYLLKWVSLHITELKCQCFVAEALEKYGERMWMIHDESR